MARRWKEISKATLPDRDVSIYLPPSYATERNRRYPVIYLLHGYTDSDDLWFGSKPHFINVPVRHGSRRSRAAALAK